MNRTKEHHIILQLGPVKLPKGDRLTISAFLTRLLNGILENTAHPKEAANFVEQVIGGRSDDPVIREIANLRVAQRVPNTKFAFESAEYDSQTPSQWLSQVHKQRWGKNDGRS